MYVPKQLVQQIVVVWFVRETISVFAFLMGFGKILKEVFYQLKIDFVLMGERHVTLLRSLSAHCASINSTARIRTARRSIVRECMPGRKTHVTAR